jgi:hypothetical protein
VASDGEIRTGGEAGRGEKWADGAVAWAVVETGGGKSGAAERDGGVREGLGGAARGGRKVERHGSDLAAGRREVVEADGGLALRRSPVEGRRVVGKKGKVEKKK